MFQFGEISGVDLRAVGQRFPFSPLKSRTGYELRKSGESGRRNASGRENLKWNRFLPLRLFFSFSIEIDKSIIYFYSRPFLPRDEAGSRNKENGLWWNIVSIPKTDMPD